MSPVLPQLSTYEKWNLETGISYEYRCTNTQQNTSKLTLEAYKKDCTLQLKL